MRKVVPDERRRRKYTISERRAHLIELRPTISIMLASHYEMNYTEKHKRNWCNSPAPFHEAAKECTTIETSTAEDPDPELVSLESARENRPREWTRSYRRRGSQRPVKARLAVHEKKVCYEDNSGKHIRAALYRRILPVNSS